MTPIVIHRTHALGAHTPMATYALFSALAKKAEKKKKRQDLINAIKAKLTFWRTAGKD